DGPAGGERFAAEIVTIVEKTIENRIDRITFSALQELEAGDALVIENDNFSVQKQRARPKAADRRGDTRKPVGAILLVSREQANVLAFFVCQDPVAIVLLLVHPARLVKGFGDERGQHRLDPERYSVLQSHRLAFQ